MKTNTKLLDAGGLLNELFPEECRPSVRWLRDQQKRRAIPYVKIGHLVFFNVDRVREVLDSQHTVELKPRRSMSVLP
jgi:hypothetical protein